MNKKHVCTVKIYGIGVFLLSVAVEYRKYLFVKLFLFSSIIRFYGCTDSLTYCAFLERLSIFVANLFILSVKFLHLSCKDILVCIGNVRKEKVLAESRFFFGKRQ